MRVKSFSLCLVFSAYFILLPLFHHPTATTALRGGRGGTTAVRDGFTARKDERRRVVWSEFGEITAVEISDGMINECYQVHFIAMDPNSIFLPAYLYSQVVFFVKSGKGSLSWMDLDKDDHQLQQLELETGDIHTLQPQTVFYLQNNLAADDDPQDLQIYAISFDTGTVLTRNQQCGRVYAGVHDLMLRFDNKILQVAFNVSEEVIEVLRGEERQPLIVQEHELETHTSMLEVSSRVLRAFLRTRSHDIIAFENKKKKDKQTKKKGKKKKDKRKAYNIFKADHDFENPYGWSVTANNEQLDHVLRDSEFSVFMVNLTEGSMIGPHWNPTSDELAIVLRGQGMVQVVCPSMASETGCESLRFRVDEGDVFVVPRDHPMAQMSFSNNSFVFMGFTMTSEYNNPTQYLVGENSVLQTLDKTVLAESFDVRNMTLMDEVLLAQKESIFMECKWCAEDEERLMEEEAERGWEGGGGGRRGADIEGEMARGEERERRRRWRKAEEAAARGGEGWQLGSRNEGEEVDVNVLNLDGF